jgi:hypothetical protein
MSGAGTVAGIPGALPGVIRTIVAGEVFTAGRDFALVVVAVLAVLGLGWRWRERLSHFTIGMMLGTAVVQVLNTTASQNRYWAMTIPVLAVLATIFVADLFTPAPSRPTVSAPATPAIPAAREAPAPAGPSAVAQPTAAAQAHR